MPPKCVAGTLCVPRCLPVIAIGGIADARGVAAALILGASAAQIGTGFLRCPEAKLPTAWAHAIGQTLPEETLVTRAFSGRPGRSLTTAYAREANVPDAPAPAPYPANADLLKRCGMLPSKTMTLTECRPGLVNQLDWLRRDLRVRSCVTFGEAHRPCSHRDSCLAGNRAVNFIVHSWLSSDILRDFDWCPFSGRKQP